MNRYTEEIQKIAQTMKAPYPGFVFDIVEFPSYLAIRVYRDNVESFSDSQKVTLAEWLYKLRDTIRAVEPKTFIDGAEGPPPSRRGK